MPDYHIHIPTESALQESVSGIPPEVKIYLAKGFAALERLSEDKLTTVMDVAKDYLNIPVSANRAEVVSKLGVTGEDAMALMTAISFSTFILTSRAATPEDFVQALKSVDVLPKTQTPGLLRLAQAINRNRAALKETLERSQVANALLPSLAKFETTIDLRLGFEKSQVGFAVPVVLMHVDTDAEGEELWFQVNQKQLEALMKDLEEARRRVDEAGKWAQNRLAQE